jgi:CAAX prenyl protease-like protein
MSGGLLSFRRAAFVRVAPFVAFMAALALRGWAPEDGSWGVDPRWLYALQVVPPALLLAWWWREYGELSRQTAPSAREWLLALAVGLAVFGLWIHLDAAWMTISAGSAGPFDPRDAAGQIDWALVALRLAGAALLVPVMEELFWRSFLMRWIQQPQFEALSPAAIGLRAVVLSTFCFMLAHTLWLAAIVAGLAYAWLYIATGRLWVAVIAHAVTNAVLGAWVLATENWQFW